MIGPDVLFDPLAIVGFVVACVIAVLVGRLRGDTWGETTLVALGSGLALAALAWALHYGDGAVFAALTAGLGATLWSTGVERGKRERHTIR